MGASNEKTCNDKQEAEEYINEKINSADVVVFSKTTCPYCIRAKRVLTSNNIPYTVVGLTGRSDCQLLQDVLLEMTGERTVPRVFIHQKCIGGCTETLKLRDEGKLMDLVNKKI